MAQGRESRTDNFEVVRRGPGRVLGHLDDDGISCIDGRDDGSEHVVEWVVPRDDRRNYTQGHVLDAGRLVGHEHVGRAVLGGQDALAVGDGPADLLKRDEDLAKGSVNNYVNRLGAAAHENAGGERTCLARVPRSHAGNLLLVVEQVLVDDLEDLRSLVKGRVGPLGLRGAAALDRLDHLGGRHCGHRAQHVARRGVKALDLVGRLLGLEALLHHAVADILALPRRVRRRR